MSYVDGFVLPVPKKNLDAYRKLARKAGKLWKEYGAIEYIECVADDVQPSPVVELNRAVAIGKAQGPAFALPLVDALCDAAQLRDYGLLYAVRGDLLEQLLRRDEARIEFERAASLAANARDRALMLARAEACAKTRD